MSPTQTCGQQDLIAYDDAKRAIEAGKRSVLEVAAALKTIRRRRLWAIEFETYGDFLAAAFGFGERHARRLMSAATTLASITDGEDRTPGSSLDNLGEHHLRELGRLPKGKRPAALAAATKTASDGKPPTVEAIRTVVDQQLGTTTGPARFWRGIRLEIVSLIKRIDRREDKPLGLLPALHKANGLAYRKFEEEKKAAAGSLWKETSE